MSAILWTIFLLQVQAAPKPAAPPAPDFKTEIDYKAWLEKYVVGGLPKEQNAAPLYTAIFGDPDDPKAKPMGFNGPRTAEKPVDEIGPWDPAKHPDWEAAYQKTKDVVQRFKEAAGKPYAWWGVRLNAPPGEPKLLIYALLSDPSVVRTLAKGASENSWRAPGGKVDEAAFVASNRAVLGLFRQLERNPVLIAQLVASAIRFVCYQDLLRAVDLEFLSDKKRADVLLMLKSKDEAGPPFCYAANAELAAVFDAIQFVMMKTKGLFGSSKETGVTFVNGAIRCNGPKARDEVVEHFATLASEVEKPYDAGTMARISAADEKMRTCDLLVAITVPSLGRAYQLLLRAETMRRGTRLVYELLAYRDKNKKWPAALQDLPLESDKSVRIDPFSNKPYAYRLDDGKPLLYSWGQNAKYDGGTTPDDHWGDKLADWDYILWPLQR